MANVNDVKLKAAVLELGGKERHMRFDLNAFAELEEAYGSIEGAMGALEKGSIKALRAIIWAGLLHEHTDSDGNPTLTLLEVGSWIDIKDLPTLSEKLGKALEQALPTADESEAATRPFSQDQEKKQPKTGGTGPQSTT